VTPKIPIPSSKEIELKGQAILKQLPKTHTQPLKMKSQFQPYGSEIGNTPVYFFYFYFKLLSFFFFLLNL